jgi:hypothetical protein
MGSAADAAAKVIAKTNSGELDMQSGKWLLDGIERFAKLYEQEVLEQRVLAIEAQLRLAGGSATLTEGPLLQVVAGE